MILRHPVLNIMNDDYRIDFCVYPEVFTSFRQSCSRKEDYSLSLLFKKNTLQHTTFENACGLRVGLLEVINSQKKITTQCTHIE